MNTSRKIFSPALFPIGLVSAKKIEQERIYIKKQSNGNVLVKEGFFHSVIRCEMNLKKFPFDVQTCPVKFREQRDFSTNVRNISQLSVRSVSAA